MSDAILPHEVQIQEYEALIGKFKEQSGGSGLWTQSEIDRLEAKLLLLRQKTYANLSAWERVTISRHKSRPRTKDYIAHICSDFVELCGDRRFGDDTALIGGFATIGTQRCVFIGQEKGNDTASRMACNFGMMNPEGFRKAMRLMRLAEKFKLPVVSMLDTPGAFPGLGAEERGQGLAIAENLRDMAVLKTPIVVVLIGEGSSGGALGIGVGDRIAMLEHSYYSVISPEGCASILWKDSAKKVEAAEALKFNSEHLLSLGLVDEVLKEPLGGAHHEPAQAYASVKNYILKSFGDLSKLDTETLLASRYEKLRKMGRHTEAASAL